MNGVKKQRATGLSLSKAIIGAVVLAALLITSPASAQTASPIVLKMAGESAVGTPSERAARDFAQMVKTRSSGRIEVRFFPAGQLGTGDAITEVLQNGSIDAVWRVSEWYSRFEPGLNIMMVGFLFKDGQQVDRFIRTPRWGELRNNLIGKAGIRILSDNGIGAPRVLVSKKAVRTPDDMKGLKMRVPNIDMYLITWTAIGVNVVQVPWGESYMALKQGVVDMLESPLNSVYGMKFQETAKFLTMTNHFYPLYFMAVNEKFYQKLPADLQQVVTEASIDTGKAFNKYEGEVIADTRQKLIAAGVTIIEPDLEPFQRKIAPTIGGLESKGTLPGGLYQYVRSLIK